MLEIIKMAILFRRDGHVVDPDYWRRIRREGDEYVVEFFGPSGWHPCARTKFPEVAFRMFMHHPETRFDPQVSCNEQPGRLTGEEIAGMKLALGTGGVVEWVREAATLIINGDPVMTDALREVLGR